MNTRTAATALHRMPPLYPHASLWFALILLVAVIGFWPSYFSRLRGTSALSHFHGTTAIAWLALLIVQGWLFRARKLRWHRLVGRTSFVLVPLFVMSGLLITQAMLAGDSPFHQVYASRLGFYDLTTVAWFTAAYALAIRHRRNLQLHARYMASTALLVLPPALTRTTFLLPGVNSFEVALHAAYAVSIGAVIVLLAHDRRRLGRPSAPYLALLAVFALHLLAFHFIQHVPAWNRFCLWLGQL